MDISINYWEKLWANANKKVKHYTKRVKQYKDNKERLEHYKAKLDKWERKLKHRAKRSRQASFNYKMAYGG